MNQDTHLSSENRKLAVRRLLETARAAQSASDVMDQAFVDFAGINRTDGRCLDVVDQHGTITAGDLAREAGLTTGAVTAVVDRLEMAGLLRRTSDPSDRRKVLIEMTPDGKSLADEVYGPLAHTSRPYLESLTDQEIFTLIGYFEASKRINLEHARAIRARVSSKKVSMRYRLEQARLLKNDAKQLLKTIKSDVKDLASLVIEVAGTGWERDESGRWVERGQ